MHRGEDALRKGRRKFEEKDPREKLELERGLSFVSTKSLSFISSSVQDKVVVKVIFIACCNDLHAKVSLTFREFVGSFVRSCARRVAVNSQ